MTGIALKKPGATLRQHTYGYNAVSNVTSHTVGGMTTTYGYDLADQLISETRLGYVASYTYDANGNRATRTVNGQTETHVSDAADKLMSISVGGNTVRLFTYDGRGRRKTDTSSGNTTVYSWDAESRLVGLTKPGLTTSYGYNGLDARISRTVGANTTTYKRAGAYVTDPVLNETTGQFSANYTPGVSERRAGVSTFLHSGLKNADARTTDGASVTAERQYDAFGNLTGGNGTWNGPFGYAGGFGYQEDGESGLKLLGHRYYDSTTGRFLSKDVARDGRNWYAYCDNNPVRRVDANGLDWVVIQMDEGGQGHGSHARIGLWDGNPKHEIQWYGLYSDGGGTFEMRDNPKMGPSRTVYREITKAERLRIQRQLMIRRMEYLQGKGKKYNLSGYNCTHFITDVLIDAGILGEDHRDSSRSPDELVRSLQNEYWTDTSPTSGNRPNGIGKGGVWPWYSPTAPPRKGSRGKGGGSRRLGS